MPIGTGHGQQFKDDFEVALHDFNKTLGEPPEFMPSIGQMRDPMEISPEPYEERGISPDLTANFFQTISEMREEPDDDQQFLSERGTFDIKELPKSQRSPLDRLTGMDGGERYQTWPEKAFRSLVDAFKLPRDVYTGEVDPSSPQAIGRAAELAGALVFGPAPIARKVVDGTLGSFVGVMANLPTEKLRKAKELAGQHGKDIDPEMLWKETGFFRGVDGRLRYEVSDEGAKINTVPDGRWFDKDKPITVGELLNHPELIKAYPDLKDVKVRFDVNKADGSAHYDYANGEITLGPNTLPDYNPSILLHEIQHWIQHKEGFNAGGSTASKYMLRWQGAVDQLKREGEKLVKKVDGNFEKLPPEEYERLLFISKVLTKDAARHGAAPDEIMRNYQRLAGEVEARNVQRRFENEPTYFIRQKDGSLVEGGRPRDEFPLHTQDVETADQAIFFRPQAATPYGYGDPMNPPK